MELAPSNGVCGEPLINWRIIKVDVDTFTPFSSFIQPNTSVLRIEPGIIDPGEYVVSLEISFPAKSANDWAEDVLIINVVLPELVTHITGGELLDVPQTEILIDATISTDPANSLSSLALTPLVANWSFVHFTVTPTVQVIHRILIDFPTITLPAGNTIYEVSAGTDYILKVDTASFPVNTYAAAMFTLSRGNRSSSALQVIRIKGNVLPLSIE